MSVSETGYDPIQVEEAIDNAYRSAESLDEEYRDLVEEAIGKVETMPYSVNEDGTYTEEEMVETINGLSMLENIQMEVWRETRDRELVEYLRDMEDYLDETAFRPARSQGMLEDQKSVKEA